jgi:hypothetical protein
LYILTIYYITLGVANPNISNPNPFLIVRITLSTTLLCYVNGDPVKNDVILLSKQNLFILLALKLLSPSPLILLTYTYLSNLSNAILIDYSVLSIIGITTRYFVLILIANR